MKSKTPVIYCALLALISVSSVARAGSFEDGRRDAMEEIEWYRSLGNVYGGKEGFAEPTLLGAYARGETNAVVYSPDGCPGLSIVSNPDQFLRECRSRFKSCDDPRYSQTWREVCQRAEASIGRSRARRATDPEYKAGQEAGNASWETAHPNWRSGY